MTNTGSGGRRTILQPNAHEMPGGLKRIRSQYEQPSWSERTRCCGRKWQSCARTSGAARTWWHAMKPNTGNCKRQLCRQRICIICKLHLLI